MELVDVLPTMCELAGLPVPESAEGKSLIPVLMDPNASVRQFALTQFPITESIPLPVSPVISLVAVSKAAISINGIASAGDTRIPPMISV